MQVVNTKYFKSLPFDEYLKIPGYSFSGIKGFQGIPTTGMQLGSRVHAYLNEPEKYDWQDADIVQPIATALRTYLGDAFHHLEKEVAFTSTFKHNGMWLSYKGRADMMKANRIIVDLKVLAGPLEPAIKRFGYENQLSGYCLAIGAPLALIVAYNKVQKKVEVKAIRPRAEYWEYQCVRLGEPIGEEVV